MGSRYTWLVRKRSVCIHTCIEIHLLFFVVTEYSLFSRPSLTGILTKDRDNFSHIAQMWTGMAMQDYGLGLRVGLKDLPTLRTRIHIKF